MTDSINWGVSAFSHDAAISIVKNNELIFASHSERWTKIKNDSNLSYDMIDYLKNKYGEPNQIFFYERPWLKLTRQLIAGQGWSRYQKCKSQLKTYFPNEKIKFTSHHHSHAAAGYFTSGYNSAAILVIDAIGEWATLSIWKARGFNIKCIYQENYPNSLGLWYSAFTKRVGLKHNEEEYIFMGMAALGDPNKYYHEILSQSFHNNKLKRNFHRGCDWFQKDKDLNYNYDIAAACQRIYTEKLLYYLDLTKKLTNEDHLIFMGGCALNCVANTEILRTKKFKKVWIFPNPGDAGNSLGAILAHTKNQVIWKNAYLGYEISGTYPVQKCLNDLLSKSITAVANGKAEFGPRALGNRSILADPRVLDIKDQINKIKKREPFRPFAPVILEEYANDFFELESQPDCYRYMQFVAKCRYPNQFPGIVHFDGTSRLQTVPKNSGTGIRLLLEKWYETTKCPMLLNTSLNIKGQPLVNDEKDANDFTNLYGLKVHIKDD